MPSKQISESGFWPCKALVKLCFGVWRHLKRWILWTRLAGLKFVTPTLFPGRYEFSFDNIFLLGRKPRQATISTPLVPWQSPPLQNKIRLLLNTIILYSQLIIGSGEQPFAVQGPVGEHPERGQSISVRCSPVYLLPNVQPKFLLFGFLASVVQGGSSMIGVGVVPECFFLKIEFL